MGLYVCRFGRIHNVLNQLHGVLFDDRHFPYHVMLEKFYSSGCHQAFCDLMTDRLAPALEGTISGKKVSHLQINKQLNRSRQCRFLGMVQTGRAAVREKQDDQQYVQDYFNQPAL